MENSQWTDLDRAWTSTLLKQSRIMLTENGTRGSQHPKHPFRALHVLQEAWRTIPKGCSNRLQETLLNRDQAVYTLCFHKLLHFI